MGNNGLDVKFYYLNKLDLIKNSGDNNNYSNNNNYVNDFNDIIESKKLFKGFENTHNCYAYAFLYSYTRNKDKPQPGEFSLYHKQNNKCYDYYKSIKNDNPHIYASNSGKCPKSTHKIFFTKEEGYGDYHFYKLDKDGYWSHKPGTTPIRRSDESGKKIRDPLYANRGRYTIPCFYACINPLFSRATSYSK